jgi:hypothetical protein
MPYFILISLLLIGCSSQDMPATVNHVHWAGYTWDLTFGPLATIIVAPLIVWAIKVILVRMFKKFDSATKQALEMKEELDKERHGHIVTKLDSMCNRFDKVDDRFHEHEHVVEIDGRLFRSNGKITGSP